MEIAVNYKELTDSMSPCSVGFSHDGGRGLGQYLTTGEDLVDSLQDILGYTEKGSNGGLVRHLPRAHPRFPWLFAERTANIQGMGKFTKVEATDDVEAAPISHGTNYAYYKITVEFAPRPYALLADEHVVPGTVNWSDDAGAPTSSTFAPEWMRFTSYEEMPATEVITFQQGQMRLHRGDADPPNLYTFPGTQSMLAPRSQILLTWHQVPYDYVTAPTGPIKKYMGRVNQTAFFGYPAGSLLYGTSPRIRVYTPPWPDESAVPGGGVTYFDRRCDITFVFDYVNRETPSAPTPANANWLAAGHNLLPWAGDRRYYYGAAFKPSDAADTAYWHPSYKSFPFQLLFTDPNFVG